MTGKPQQNGGKERYYMEHKVRIVNKYGKNIGICQRRLEGITSAKEWIPGFL